MRFLIVDDEPNQCEWLKRIILDIDQHHEIQCAINGESALRLLRAHPFDMLFTDICMPVMDGLTLVQKAREAFPGLSLVLITSHQRFDYALSGLRLGVADYILKPFDREQIRQTIERIASPAADANTLSLNGNLTAYGEQVLHNWLLGQSAQKAEIIQLLSDGPWYAVAALQCGAPCKERFDAFLESLRALLKDEPIRWQCYVPQETPDQVLLITGSKAESLPDMLSARLLEAGCHLPQPVFVAQALPIHGLDSDMLTLYHTIRNTLSYHFYYHTSQVLPCMPTGSEPIRMPPELREQLTDALGKSDKAIAACISDIFAYAGDPRTLVAPNDLLSTLNIWISELLQRLGPYLQPEARSDIQQLYTQCFSQTGSARVVRKNLLQLALRLHGEVDLLKGNHHQLLIESCLRYIQTHYASPISLEQIANQAYMSPSYFCTVFRKSTGKSFIQYVTEYRMQQATLLLKDPSMQIQDVAARVGYTDTRYFSRLFHRKYGCTPNEYRFRLAIKR